MKIVYIIDSLASKGGAERVLSDKMNYMVDHFGYDVYVITCYQNQQKSPNTYYLSKKVRQINLDIPYYSHYHYRNLKRLWTKWKLYRRLVRQLRETIQRINPDILVGLGYFNADVVTGIPCRAVKMVESHEARCFLSPDEALSRSFLSRAYMKTYRKIYLKNVERQADVIITLTKGDAREWAKAKRVEVIPNFSVIPVLHQSTCKNKRVIAVGRLEWQKGYDRLIYAWSYVHQKHPEWKLDIYGSGTYEARLKSQIRNQRLDDSVTIHPFTSDIGNKYSESSIFTLTSHFEGFSLVLLEAMRHGLPSVVFDCPYGPGDVVDDGKTGFVVKEGDITTFAEKTCKLIENEELRLRFSRASLERAKLFEADIVIGQWKKLLDELLLKK